MDSPIFINGRVHSYFCGVSDDFFNLYCILHRNTCNQIVLTLIRHFAASELGLQRLRMSPKRGSQSKKGEFQISSKTLVCIEPPKSSLSHKNTH